MNHDAIIFDIDDTLYNSTRLSITARGNAIEAMIDAGLPVDRETGTELLAGVIQRLGANSNRHFDELLEAVGVPPNARLIAAGIVAYHNTKPVYLRPFEETIPTLLRVPSGGDYQRHGSEAMGEADPPGHPAFFPCSDSVRDGRHGKARPADFHALL